MSSTPHAPEWLVLPADVNELVEGIWPPSAARNSHGELTVGGVSASHLVGEHGTPVLVIDEDAVRTRAAEVRHAFDSAAARNGTTAQVYYAGKAMLNTEVARWMTAAGLNIDVCTGGELEVALAAAVDPARLGFHGNNKSVAELQRAIEVGVGTVIIDSEQELDRLVEITSELPSAQAVMLRVSSGVHAETHSFLATAHEDQKFGVPLSDAVNLVDRIRHAPGLRFLGLHCHIGSQIFDVAGFHESARRVLDVHQQLLAHGEVPQLNLGGGFGIAYISTDTPAPIEQLAGDIVDAVVLECQRRGIPLPVLAFEPGRTIIGRAGITLYEVGTTKTVTLDDDAHRRYISVDGGMSDNPRHALYGAQYSARIVSRESAAVPILSRIVGRHCESGDIVVDHEYLPEDTAPGDLLAVAATGAYCASLSSNYNHVPRPAVVAVANGRSRVLVRGETISDLLARDTGVPDTYPRGGEG